MFLVIFLFSLCVVATHLADSFGTPVPLPRSVLLSVFLGVGGGSHALPGLWPIYDLLRPVRIVVCRLVSSRAIAVCSTLSSHRTVCLLVELVAIIKSLCPGVVVTCPIRTPQSIVRVVTRESQAASAP